MPKAVDRVFSTWWRCSPNCLYLSSRGQVGTVIGSRDADTLLVEFCDDDGCAYAVEVCPARIPSCPASSAGASRINAGGTGFAEAGGRTHVLA